MSFTLAIANTNTLSNIALQSILADIIPNVDIQLFNSAKEIKDFEAKNPIVHYFVGANIIFNALDFFMPLQAKTVVLCEGDSAIMKKYGFRTIDISQPEKTLLKALLGLHQYGHPHGHKRLEQTAEKESTTQPILSPREREVLKLVVLGYYNKEIGEKLNITSATVAFHRNNVSSKLGSRSIGHLTICAVLHGIIKLEEL